LPRCAGRTRELHPLVADLDAVLMTLLPAGRSALQLLTRYLARQELSAAIAAAHLGVTPR